MEERRRERRSKRAAADRSPVEEDAPGSEAPTL
jgi:hypothetical protein